MLFYVNVEPRQLYKFTKIAGRTIVTLVNIRREIERRPSFHFKRSAHYLCTIHWGIWKIWRSWRSS